MPENIYAVIMAGGRGERFWPECRANRPKQLLNLFGNAPLIEQTVLRLQGFVPFHNILIITNEAYLERIRALLPQIPPDNIIGEPCARDTAPCVALAAGVVKAKAGSEDAVMILLPADHFIVRQQAMIADLNTCAGAVAGRHAIATIGITPYAPSPNYGYIECGEPLEHSGGTFFKVRRFTENPPSKKRSGFLRRAITNGTAACSFFGENHSGGNADSDARSPLLCGRCGAALADGEVFSETAGGFRQAPQDIIRLCNHGTRLRNSGA